VTLQLGIAVPPTIRAFAGALLEVVNVGDLGIVLFSQSFGRSSLFSLSSVPTRYSVALNAIEEAVSSR